jgi:hypothetical protein
MVVDGSAGAVDGSTEAVSDDVVSTIGRVVRAPHASQGTPARATPVDARRPSTTTCATVTSARQAGH